MYGSSIGVVSELKNSTGTTTAIPVASTATAYSSVFSLFGGVTFGIELLAAKDSGDVDVLVQLEESNDGMNFVVPDGLADVVNLVDVLRHIKQVTPAPAKYGRLKLIGQGSNAASTTVTINLFIQERL